MVKKSERRTMAGIVGESRILFTLHSSLLTAVAIAWDNPAPVHDDAASGTG
jgi:hypothetical protein